METQTESIKNESHPLPFELHKSKQEIRVQFGEQLVKNNPYP